MTGSPDPSPTPAEARWRLVLGQFAKNRLCLGGGGYDAMDRALNFLYGREYRGRNVRAGRARQAQEQDPEGGSEASVFQVPDWIRSVRELFPAETCEVIQRHALERYQMKELVTDKQTLEQMQPSFELLKTLLTFRGMMQGEVLELAHRLIREVVEDLRRRMAQEVRQTLWGRLNKVRRTRHKIYRNLDWVRTIRANLKNYDPERRTLVLEHLHFFSRVHRTNPWHIILCVDTSGSMLDSVIHSAVMAGIFHGLPSLRVSFVAFDTAVVDLSDEAGDPVELLLSVQLGGGTDIHKALCYCETIVQAPSRTILVLVTDFREGGSPAGTVAAVRRLRESGVRVIGLAALSSDAQPSYHREMAQQCVDAGAEVAAVTPRRLAEWIGSILE
jgi:Mg-chelatase subunit ChlD